MTDVKRLINMSIDIDVNLTNSLENKKFSEMICEICVIDKQHKTSSRKSHIRIIKVDELVHTNLVDDDKIFKIDKEFKYVTTMIDDYSEHMIIYLLEQKFELKDVLRDYLKLMKTWSTLIYRLCSDNENEYADHQIIELLKEHEIKWELTTSYNSSQNEIAKRCFYTLFERTCAILTSVKLLIRLWEKTIMTVIYLKNRSSITALNNITFYETWHDKKSDLSYLHTFECIVYHYVKKAHWKLDDKSLKCQFLSYKRVNQFRLWNDKKILISSHIQWDEIIIEVKKYNEDLLILFFNDQIEYESFSSKSFLIISIENAKITKILDDYSARTSSATSKCTIIFETSVASQKARSRSLKLKSSESDSLSNSDASSKCFKWAIAESVDYRALNNLWVKDHNWDFVSKANRVQIKLNTSQTVKHARASFDWKQWKLAFRSKRDAHIKSDILLWTCSTRSALVLTL